MEGTALYFYYKKMFLKVKNNASGALRESITSIATQLLVEVGQGSNFPDENFNISLGDEIILCTSRTEDVLTVVRGAENTTAATHALGCDVELRLTAEAITELQEAVTILEGRDEFTEGDATKLSGIADGANLYVHPDNHSISTITGLQTELDSKSDSHSHPYLSDSTETISEAQANAIVANTDKVGITIGQSDEITANTVKRSYSSVDEIKLGGIDDNANLYVHPSNHSISEISGLQTELDSKDHSHPYLADSITTITPQQASDIVENNAKNGITPTQTSNITANNAKRSFPTIYETKIDGVDENANLYVHPNNHTIDEITDLQTELDSKSDSHAHPYLADTTTTISEAQATDISTNKTHTTETNNPHSVTKDQVGLGNANNTSDVNKPISTATQTALDDKVDVVSGKGLTPEEFTAEEKTKLAGLDSSLFLGTFSSLVALQTAHPSPDAGSNAYVDLGIGEDVVEYLWDDTDNEYLLQQGSTTAETPASVKTKYESNADTNVFTDSEKTKLDESVNYVHPASHTISEVSGLQDELDGKDHSHPYLADSVTTISEQQGLDITANNLKRSYPTGDETKLSGIATGANLYVHPTSHTIGEITNLQNELDGKSDTHSHPYLADSVNTISIEQEAAIVANTDKRTYPVNDETKLSNIADNANLYVHPDNHSISEVTGLQTELDGKSDNHSHPYMSDNVTTISAGQADEITANSLKRSYPTEDETKLSGIATGANLYVHPASHAIGDVTGLQTEIDTKSDIHSHPYLADTVTTITATQANDIGSNNAHRISTHAPSNAQAHIAPTKAEVEGVLTGEISSHEHTGGGASVGGLYGINVETLTGDKTLVAGTDKIYQHLDVGGADRNIILDTTSATVGDRFEIKNSSPRGDYDYLQIKQATTLLDKAYFGAIKRFVFDGTNWVGNEIGTMLYDTDNSISLGKDAMTGYSSIAIGQGANSQMGGVGIGQYTNSSQTGVAIGNSSDGYNRGVAIGYSTSARYTGVALGYRASTNSNKYSVAIGSYAENKRCGEIAFAIGSYGQYPDNIATIIGLYLTTSNSTPTELECAGETGKRIKINASSILSFKIQVSARDNTSGDCAVYHFKGAIKRDGASNTALVGNLIKEVIAEEDVTWDCEVTADDTNEALIITVTGDATNTVQWAARLDGVETKF